VVADHLRHWNQQTLLERGPERGEHHAMSIKGEAGVFARYEAAFPSAPPPLMHWDEARGYEALFKLMEAALARGRALSAEELGGGHPEGTAV
jgi:hypothetical protein